MSHASQAHADHHGGADHVPHVLPEFIYYGVWVALLILTAITVGVSYLDFGMMNLVIAMAVATVKAALVSLLFMHLFFDRKFHMLVFVSSLVFLGIFITFTMLDTESRGAVETIEGQQVADIKNPFAGTKAEKDAADARKQAEAAKQGKAEGKPGNAH